MDDVRGVYEEVTLERVRSYSHKYGKICFPYLGIKNMNIDYKKCHANSILIVCMRVVPKNTMVNAVDYRNLDTLRLSVN